MERPVTPVRQPTARKYSGYYCRRCPGFNSFHTEQDLRTHDDATHKARSPATCDERARMLKGFFADSWADSKPSKRHSRICKISDELENIDGLPRRRSNSFVVESPTEADEIRRPFRDEAKSRRRVSQVFDEDWELPPPVSP